MSSLQNAAASLIPLSACSSARLLGSILTAEHDLAAGRTKRWTSNGALVSAFLLLLLSSRVPSNQSLMYSTGADSFDRNMTEVLFPTQSFDSSQFSTADWFLGPAVSSRSVTFGGRGCLAPLWWSRIKLTIRLKTAAPTGNERNLGHTPVAAPAAVPQSLAQISDIPARAHLSQDQQNPFSASTFPGLEGSMPQVNNPFETPSTPAHPISQPTLYSNIKTPAASVPHTPTASSRPFAPIAPDPVGLQRIQAVKQHHDSDDSYDQRTKKRRLTSSSMETPQQPPPLRDEDKLLLQLKDEQSLPWKDIAARFQTETGKVHMIPALQMRYKRLKERLQQWTDPDVEALKQAHDYWETKKFDIISSKVRHAPSGRPDNVVSCSLRPTLPPITDESSELCGVWRPA